MNKLTKYTLLLVAGASLVACSERKKAEANFNVIPLPQEITTQNGASYLLTPATVIVYELSLIHI